MKIRLNYNKASSLLVIVMHNNLQFVFKFHNRHFHTLTCSCTRFSVQDIGMDNIPFVLKYKWLFNILEEGIMTECDNIVH